MTMVLVALRFRGYETEGGEKTLDVPLHDDDKTAKALRTHLDGAIRADRRDPREDGHLYDLRVRRTNRDHLFDFGWTK